MTLAAGGRAPLWPVLLVWLVISALLVAAFGHAAWARLPGDTDDLMRLLQVRDWLGGQSWWDVAQHRMDPPAGVPMHWSRIVDLPVAAVILLAAPLGRATAESVALVVVPVVTLACLMLAVAALARRLLPGESAAPALAAGFVGTSFFVVIQLIPGRIDHHGWQMVLAAVAMLGLFDRWAWRGGLIAGAALATGLAISIEGLPLVAALGAVVGLRWAATGEEADARRLAGLALSLAGVSLALFVATRPMSGWFGPWCDVVTPGHLVALVVAGAFLAPLPFRSGRPASGKPCPRHGLGIAGGNPDPKQDDRWVGGGVGIWWDISRGSAKPSPTPTPPSREGLSRLLFLAIVAGIALAAFLSLSPTCAADPFGGLDPLVRRVWYVNVLEGQPVWRQTAGHQVQMLWLPIIGLAGAIVGWRRGDARDWLTVIALLVAATLIGLSVRRAIGTAQIAAIPGAVLLALTLFRRARAIARPVTRTVASAVALLLPSPLAALYAQALLQPAAEAPAPPAACNMACALDRVASLPPGDMLTPIDLGPVILSRTRDRVVAGPYHRAPGAIGDVIRAYTGDVAAAHAIVRRRHLAYVLVEPGSSEAKLYRKLAPGGLMARLETDRPPTWLRPVPLGPGPLKLWLVT